MASIRSINGNGVLSLYYVDTHKLTKGIRKEFIPNAFYEFNRIPCFFESARIRLQVTT